MPRPKHPRPEGERLLRDAEKQNWRVVKNGYFKVMCTCAEKHQSWIHLTPSDPNYFRQKRAWLERSTCWRNQP